MQHNLQENAHGILRADTKPPLHGMVSRRQGLRSQNRHGGVAKEAGRGGGKEMDFGLGISYHYEHTTIRVVSVKKVTKALSPVLNSYVVVIVVLWRRAQLTCAHS